MLLLIWLVGRMEYTCYMGKLESGSGIFLPQKKSCNNVDGHKDPKRNTSKICFKFYGSFANHSLAIFVIK